MTGITRLTLPSGAWIDVKDRLRVRDTREVHTHAVDGVSSDGATYRLNMIKHQIATAAVRIMNWSVMDDGTSHKSGEPQLIPWPVGKSPFKERVEVIEGLDEDAFDEITKALNAHLKKIDADAVTEKNATADGETDSGQTSPSVN
jgi:hypothetical protein